MSRIVLSSYIGNKSDVVINEKLYQSGVFSDITTIGMSCFQNKNITTVQCNYITNIYSNAFTSCTLLSNISFPTCSYIGYQAFYYCSNLTTVSFPACDYIGDSAFVHCEKISTASFPNCNYIGNIAFYQCKNLTGVSFPNCSYIGNECFRACKLNSIYFPLCRNIGYYAFVGNRLSNWNGLENSWYKQDQGCLIKKANNILIAYAKEAQYSTIINESCTYIFGGAFAYCSSITTVSFPNCSLVGKWAFRDCTALTNISFQSCNLIGSSCFHNCDALQSVTFPNCLYIEESAFHDCSNLTAVSFPNCSYFENDVFLNCISLTTVSFPNCSYIGQSVFQGCTALSTAYFMGSYIISTPGSILFSSCTNLQSIYVQFSLLTSYKNAAGWSYYSTKIKAGDRLYVGQKPVNPPAVIYNGSELTNGYTCPLGVTMTGCDRGTNVGSYVATYTLNEGYIWDDETEDVVTITLTINKAHGIITVAPADTQGTAVTYSSAPLCTSGEANCTIYYSAIGSSSGFTTSIPRRTWEDGGGTFTVWYYCEDENHIRSSIDSVSCHLYPDYLCLESVNSGGSISMNVTGSPTRSISLAYSTDRYTWTQFTPGSTSITGLSSGVKVYFKGYNPEGISYRGDTTSGQFYYTFVLGGSFKGDGNIMSLLDNGYCTSRTISGRACFYRLFYGCSSLISAPKLPALNLTTMCYYLLFRGCGITEMPYLPATHLAEGAYNQMFSTCTQLSVTNTIEATTISTNSFISMFLNCSSLQIPPSLSKVTNSAYGVYTTMFAGCTSLIKVPQLPAAAAGEQCFHSMFNGCSSLIISDSPASECTKEWRLPMTGTFSTTQTMPTMFAGCPGTRSTDTPTFTSGSYKIYNTQYDPV